MNENAEMTIYHMLKGMERDELRNEAMSYYGETVRLQQTIAEKDMHIDALRRAVERLEHELQERERKEERK